MYIVYSQYNHLAIMVCFVVLILLLLGSQADGSTQDCQSGKENAKPCGNYCELLEEVRTQFSQLQEAFDNLPKTPCAEIKNLLPHSSSGYYDILVEGENHTVYCNMDELCGDSGGWMRVAYLNMSDPSEQCPPGFKLYDENGIRACGRQSSGCQSIEFPSHNINYTRVCGRVTGYQKGTPDGVSDGVSITRGNQQRHIWTFMAGYHENKFFSDGSHECPCAPNSPASVTVPSFIGNDYFCESGNSGGHNVNMFYTADPLWDGKQCGLLEETCCNVTGIPWFNKTMEQPTTDYIELRVCGDQGIGDEDVPVGYYEIYVK